MLIKFRNDIKTKRFHRLSAQNTKGGYASKIKALITDLKSDENAAIMPLIAFSLVALVAVTGLAIDSARAFYVKDILQRSVDAAGLAAGHALDPIDSEADAEEFFEANFTVADSVAIDRDIVVDLTDPDVVLITGTAIVGTTFMSLFGFETISVEASAEITRSTRGLELALVLDNTGSMALPVNSSATNSPTRLDALKTASDILLGSVYGDATVVPNLFVSVVPFVINVNVGSNQTNFLSAAGQQRITDGDYSTAGWAGCIFARNNNEDQTETPPNIQPFEPFFWPDTSVFSGTNNANNWIGTRAVPAGGGFAQGAPARINEVNDRGPGVFPEFVGIANGGQRFYESRATGPNRGCPQEILPLTASRQTVFDEIDRMEPWPFGGTAANYGLVWGWRTLSEEWKGLWVGGDNPNELPLDYDEPFTDKVIILLTDGDNQHGTPLDLTSYGTSADFTSAPESIFSDPTAELDRRFIATCDNAKTSRGVLIYTVALSVDVPQATRDLLLACASNPNFFFFADDADSLNNAFQRIGRQLSELRISR